MHLKTPSGVISLVTALWIAVKSGNLFSRPRFSIIAQTSEEGAEEEASGIVAGLNKAANRVALSLLRPRGVRAGAGPLELLALEELLLDVLPTLRPRGNRKGLGLSGARRALFSFLPSAVRPRGHTDGFDRCRRWSADQPTRSSPAECLARSWDRAPAHTCSPREPTARAVLLVPAQQKKTPEFCPLLHTTGERPSGAGLDEPRHFLQSAPQDSCFGVRREAEPILTLYSAHCKAWPCVACVAIR